MREIKFRAWSKRGSKMVWGNCNLMLDLNGGKWWSFGFNEPEPLGEDNEFILMQYTGLKDKNGKEIYEGDVLEQTLKWPTERIKRDVVSFKEGQFVAGDSETSVKFYLKTNPAFVVIGNIYENPELLEERRGGGV